MTRTFVITDVDCDFLENLQTIHAESETGERLRLRMSGAQDSHEVGEEVVVDLELRPAPKGR